MQGNQKKENKEDSLLSAMQIGEEDGDLKLSVRPSDLSTFVGQKVLKENLKTFIDSAKIRNSTIDHTIFYGPPGLGKTTLANIIANEMGVNIITTAGPLLTKAGDLAAILTNIKKGDILFIDEIHRMTKMAEEMLYSAMEDFRLDIIIGEGPAARSIKINLPTFTVVGATTQLGLISAPLLGRFGIMLSLDFYDPNELKEIIMVFVNKVNMRIDGDAALLVAKLSRRTPRIALRLIRRVIDFATVEHLKIINTDIVEKTSKKMQIDNLGLDRIDIAYLLFLLNKCNGGPVGVSTIATGISESIRSVEEVIEPFLIKEGFITKTSRGRVLTNRAILHVRGTNIGASESTKSKDE